MEIYYLLSAPVLSDELLQILDEKIVELNTARAAFALVIRYFMLWRNKLLIIFKIAFAVEFEIY